ncbi:MAG: tripartite tricarboxylate transporter TctB family protein [Defluviitaleaceae bacterium]|nr:tripartite tricarboxylate transporter TctB family protein [Defluviitaleaceae bacterium]
MKEQKHVNFVSAVIFIILAIYVLVNSVLYSQDAADRFNLAFHNSPGLFPLMVGTGLLIASVILLIQSLRDASVKEHISKAVEGGVSFVKSPTSKRAAIGIAWMAVYVFALLPQLSFVVGTIIYLIVFMLYLRATSLINIVLISCVTVGVTYLVFQGLFSVILP